MRCFFFFFSSRRRHTRCSRDWSSDVCSSDLLLVGVFGTTLAARNSCLPFSARSPNSNTWVSFPGRASAADWISSGTAGAAGLAAAGRAGLLGSEPQPATRTDIGRRRRHKRNGIFPVRTAPAPTILFRKDGARPVPLAHERSFDEVFTIQPWARERSPDIGSGCPTFPGVLRIASFGGTSGRAESFAEYHNSNC